MNSRKERKKSKLLGKSRLHLFYSFIYSIYTSNPYHLSSEESTPPELCDVILSNASKNFSYANRLLLLDTSTMLL